MGLFTSSWLILMLMCKTSKIIIISGNYLDTQLGWCACAIKTKSLIVAEQNLLKLNISKCEIVLFSKQASSSALPVCEVDGSVLPAGDTGKCLGYWWKGDLSASRSVEENIRRHIVHFSTTAALVFSKVTSVLYHLER